MRHRNEALIAYNVLEEKIVKAGFCTLCGACEAACPTNALKVDGETIKRLHNCSDFLDLCPICYEICPHSEALLLRSLSFVADAPGRSEALGYYRKIILAQAVDSKLRELCRGGAVVTSLLTYGVKNGVFDAAIVSKAEAEIPAKPKPSVAIVQDDILSAVGSKFFPSAVAKAYGSAVHEYGRRKVAFAGVPCHVLALRKMEAWQHKIIQSLSIVIGLFCFGTFSLSSVLNRIKEAYGVNPSEIKHMSLSKEFTVQTEKEKIRIPMHDIVKHLLPSCKTCVDFTAELADISVGSAYPLHDWSVVIIRTKAGEEFFYRAVEDGVLNTGVIEYEPLVLERVMIAALNKRFNALKEAERIQQAYGYLPVLMLRETEELAIVKVEDIMTRYVKSVPAEMSVKQLLSLMAKERHVAYPVINSSGKPIGIVTIEEASNVPKEKRSNTAVGTIARKTLVTAKVGETALDVFRKMSAHETGRVLIVSPEDPDKVVGLVTKTDLMHALIIASQK
ncbi:MAG: Coenzyme F420 hydrogenase/dehydrogenase, beta subunit C-terminal domain [Nitrososphaerota archaeon]|nr:Coenzyme F420 hydrogenase/dehydrogenase, beta subunit C-terminal domain [Candidatus Bathyarchaeota archaeon]MDW8193653.1 Coenzyme F420 hydrogenase/dehydrogenase, beta subunit C-terminal domain [Nitrososphaerota archaeon]